MLQIVCINKNNYLGRGKEYIEILFDSVRRNLPEGLEGKFTCFSDEFYKIDGIEFRSLPDDLEGWYNKLYLFKDGLFPEGDRIIYFDLDTVIVSILDDIVKYSGNFAILKDFYRPNGYQSSVMSWIAGQQGHLWDKYVEAGFPHISGGDQIWVERHVEKVDFWQDLYPDRFVSYKLSCKYGIPKKSSVIVFHGEPRPHEAGGWVDKVWKIDGAIVPEMLVVGNTDDKTIIENVKEAVALNYPVISQEAQHDGHAILVGGGPSLASTLNEITFRQSKGQKVFALNNAYDYLLKNGIRADYHIMLDARPENADFVPINCDLLYASQCHPDVFYKANGQNIKIWHPIEVADIVEDNREITFIGGGSTVGLKAMCLVYILGYREIHLYGYDSSYDQTHHAYEQKLNDGERILDISVGERDFKAAPWMATQADEFTELAPLLVHLGCTISVHGDGLIPYITSQMQIGVSPADERCAAILEKVKDIPNPIGVEVGVFNGDLSRRLLERQDLTLHMVDSWQEHGIDSEYAKSGDFHGVMTHAQQEASYYHTLGVIKFAKDRAIVIRDNSITATKFFEDNSMDFVFLDADHTYEAVKEDMSVWSSKVKPGGWLCGHDYENIDYPSWGVEKAVKEFCIENNSVLQLGQNFTWFVQIGE